MVRHLILDQGIVGSSPTSPATAAAPCVVTKFSRIRSSNAVYPRGPAPDNVPLQPDPKSNELGDGRQGHCEIGTRPGARVCGATGDPSATYA